MCVCLCAYTDIGQQMHCKYTAIPATKLTSEGDKTTHSHSLKVVG